jgi:glutamate dehydrogenase (NADP+)
VDQIILKSLNENPVNGLARIKSITDFIVDLEKRNPHEPEFKQAVTEAVNDLIPFIEANPRYQNKMILERLTEPDRVITFRVSWMDDGGNIRMNRGYRVQNSNAIGPYKGGIRFHPSVNLSILKFLAFEQTLKNSLTGLPMGGAKGGSDFDPKEKSDAEVMRFCQALITELWRHIGSDTDVPAGDIGVGAREVGYMFGQYKRLSNSFTGAFTGKGIDYGGSLGRTEATGYGAVYMLAEVMTYNKEDLAGKRVLVSGSGNVAVYAAEKAMQMGAIVNTLSDSSGFIYDKNGFTYEKLEYIKQLKFIDRGRIEKYCDHFEAEFHAGKKPWGMPADVALPCATQNEIQLEDAKALVANGCKYLVEGANMPTSIDAIGFLLENKVHYVPGKAANAGGVAVSGLEMSQNSLRIGWTAREVDLKLHDIMRHIHNKCVQHGKENGFVNYSKGANIAGFIKVADAMLALGVV